MQRRPRHWTYEKLILLNWHFLSYRGQCSNSVAVDLKCWEYYQEWKKNKHTCYAVKEVLLRFFKGRPLFCTAQFVRLWRQLKLQTSKNSESKPPLLREKLTAISPGSFTVGSNLTTIFQKPQSISWSSHTNVMSCWTPKFNRICYSLQISVFDTEAIIT